MKAYRSLFLFLLPLASCSIAPASSSSLPSSSIEESSSSLSSSAYEGPNIRQKYVRTNGTELLGDDDKPFTMKGTNAGGLFVHERWMCLTDSPDLLMTINTLTERFSREDAWEALDVYQDNFWTSEDFENCKNLGMNTIRLPISYADVYDCDFDLMRSDSPTAEDVMNMRLVKRKEHLKKIDRFIYDAEEHGLYVVLDLHGAFGSQNGNDHSIDSRGRDWLWKQDELGEAFRELTLDCWVDLASRYASFKNIVAYDLLNEPAGDSGDLEKEGITSVTGPVQWDYFDRLYQAIRAVDPNHILITESCWTQDNLPHPSRYGWENVIYEFHHYEGSGQGDDDYQINSYRSRVRGLVNAGFGLPIYMGEFCPHCSYEGYGRILDIFNEYGISWTSWTYRVRGWSEWGLYLVRTDPGEEHLPYSEIPGIYRGRDSYDEILRKWGPSQRNGIHQNEELCDVFAKATGAKKA